MPTEVPAEVAFLPIEPPRNRVFATLRLKWREMEKGRKYQDLAEQLSVYLKIKVTPQKLAQWATASDNRCPPWAAIYWLMHATGYEVVLTITNSGAKLIRPRIGAPKVETPAP